MKWTRCVPVAFLVGALFCGGVAVLPSVVEAKVFLYAITQEGDGDLIKYDPDMDQVTTVQSAVDPGSINERNPGRNTSGRPSRILDIARRRIVTIVDAISGPGVVLLNLQAKQRAVFVVGPWESIVARPTYLVYPRKASRFYVQWLRRQAPAALEESVMTVVDSLGQPLETQPSPIALGGGFFTPHPDGRSFYALNQPRTLLRVDGETLAVLETYDLGGFYRPGVASRAIYDVQGGRALLSEDDNTRGNLFDPQTVFTVDLAAQTASPRIATGLGATEILLTPGGQTLVLQEARTADSDAGAGRLHFYEVGTGAKLGVVSFRADDGAQILGFQPDGRRLFLRAFNYDSVARESFMTLVIVDVAARTVLRERRIDAIGPNVDFVDEP